MRQLSVFLCNDYVGLLTCDSRQHFSFQYDLQWISKKHVSPLSLSLPIREEAYSDEKTRPFFTNLLPESAVREAVARKLGISLRNDFGLLEALGGECAGAVTLLPEDVQPEKEHKYRELSAEQLHKIIKELSINPFLAGESGIRLSLAGAQEKLPVYMEKDRFFLPQGTSPSSHIIKPNIKDIDSSVRNEAFCMGLAKNLGLLVPRVEVMTVQEDLYVVDRYDRIRDEKGKLYRLHQEDFCQAIGFMPENKYEEEGGPSLSDCFSLIDRFSTNPALDRKQMLDWIIFNYLIHNADGHAKNLSLILSPDEIRLAPFYDLICTGIYGGINEKLAMKIGGENRLQWLMQRHWERLAEGIGIRTKFVLQNVMKMATQIEDAAHKLASEQQKKWGPTSIVEQIQKIIAKQVKHTKSAIG